MSEKSLNMEMANLICRFGRNKVLLDLADEIVLPSFMDKELIREYNKSKHFFYDVKLIDLGSNDEVVLAVAGRFVKDTILERDQIFDIKKGLLHDEGTMRSSPSSFFLLILNNHRLIYVKETRFAPDKNTFRSTLLSFLKAKHKDYIDSLYEEIKSSDAENVTKKYLREEVPAPTLDLISLTSSDNIGSFIKKFKTLKSMEIKFSKRNDETDNEPFFDQLQSKKDKVGSSTTVLVHKNSDGLDLNAAIEEVGEATAQGNQMVKLTGKDSHGDDLRGNNDSFQIRKPIDELESDIIISAKSLYSDFCELINLNLINIPRVSNKALSIVKKLSEGKINE